MPTISYTPFVHFIENGEQKTVDLSAQTSLSDAANARRDFIHEIFPDNNLLTTRSQEQAIAELKRTSHASMM